MDAIKGSFVSSIVTSTKRGCGAHGMNESLRHLSHPIAFLVLICRGLDTLRPRLYPQLHRKHPGSTQEAPRKRTGRTPVAPGIPLIRSPFCYITKQMRVAFPPATPPPFGTILAPFFRSGGGRGHGAPRPITVPQSRTPLSSRVIHPKGGPL